MDINSLIGKSFHHHSFDSVKRQRWEVIRVNPETKYVYVETSEGIDKIGQWIPAAWFDQLLAPDRLRHKIDALRKSRDYFRQERDELNERIASVSASQMANRGSLVEELHYVKAELDITEKDLRFWKSFALYASLAAFVCFGCLFLFKWVFC
jgi:hypothetical protein